MQASEIEETEIVLNDSFKLCDGHGRVFARPAPGIRLVVETGSFSAAARRLNRAQSAITYAVQKLEQLVGDELFDRGGYRPILSTTGRTLLPQARRILEDVEIFRTSAKQIARGLEPEVRIVVASGISLTLLTPALSGFRDAFPTVQVRLTVLPFSFDMGPDSPALVAGAADLRILLDHLLPKALAHGLIAPFNLVPVAAPSHPLASQAKPFDVAALRDHLQIVLSEVREAVPGQELRVVSLRTWRVTDPAAQHALIRAGIGWGSLPDALVADDIVTGHLIRLPIEDESRALPASSLAVVAAYRRNEPPGPAGQWLFDRLTTRPDRR